MRASGDTLFLNLATKNWKQLKPLQSLASNFKALDIARKPIG
jgi:hypothetical protein